MAYLLQWFMSPTGRLAAAAVVFALIWAIKNLPGVAKWLSTDRRRLVANVVLSLAPTAMMLVDQQVPAAEAWQAALSTLLGAAGIQGIAKVLLGKKLNASTGISSVAPELKPAEEKQVEAKSASSADKPAAGEP